MIDDMTETKIDDSLGHINVPQHKTRAVDIGTKYIKSIRSSLDNSPAIRVDIYDVLTAFNVTCPARQHAIKKIIFAGSRGSKSAEMDLDEAGNSIKRAKELLC